jgi:hypothetical protein
MFLRKTIFVMIMIIILFSCSLDEDDTESQAIIQFKYETFGPGMLSGQPIYPVRFFDTNPAIPDMPEHFAYYKTKPGQYYLEYVLHNNRAYYMIYTIEIWKDSLSEIKTCSFTIDLSFTDSRPQWDDPSWYYTDDVEIEPIIGQIPSRSVIPQGSNVGPLLYRITQKKEVASMIIEYGILYEGE